MSVWGEPSIETVDRQQGVGGELVLRRDGEHYEIISNGVFLMDTREGRSARLLVRVAVEAVTGRVSGRSVLVGGFGVGFSVDEALAGTGVERVVVVEREPAVLEWGRTHLAEASGRALEDPRVEAVCADVVTWLDSAGSAGERLERFDAICLDIDNGPDWTVTEGNAELYGDAGLASVHQRLRPGGVLSVWSAQESPAFTERLRAHFDDVTTWRVEVPRGEPDIVLLARRRGAGPAGD